MNIRITNRFAVLLRSSLVCFGVLLSSLSASAFTAADAAAAMTAYNNAFYVPNGGNAYYKNSTTDSTRTGFWKSANDIAMIIDAYQKTGDSTYYNMITPLCNGFTANNGTTWSSNTWNDDIQWACLAFLQAYSITGNATFANIAKSNFDMMYARGWDSQLGGGIYENTLNETKNAISNDPASIAAYKIYQYTGDSTYLTKSQALLNWVKSTLYDSTTGGVNDHIDLNSVVTTSKYSYNQGMFMGACFYQGDAANVTKAGDFAKNTWGTTMQVLGQGGSGGGFNGICLRWMNVTGYDSTYRQAVADNAWSMRRTSDNLCWNNWSALTPTGTLYSWDCGSLICAMFNVGSSTPPPPPPTPTGLTATAGNAQVSLSWTASSGATSYNVKRATVSGGPYTTVSSPTTASYVDTGLTNGTTYYYVVSAVNAGGESANTSQVSATPQVMPALVQSGPYVQADASTSISLTLPAASHAGNLLVATLLNQSGNTLTAPAGWVLAKTANVNGSCVAWVWYYPNCPGGITSVTFTCGASSFPKGAISEWSGLSTTSPLDVTGSSSPASTSSAVVSTSGATTGSSDLAIAYFVDHVAGGTLTFTPGAGWTNLVNNNSANVGNHMTVDYKLGVSGTVSETETSTVSGNWNNLIVTFKK